MALISAKQIQRWLRRGNRWQWLRIARLASVALLVVALFGWCVSLPAVWQILMPSAATRLHLSPNRLLTEAHHASWTDTLIIDLVIGESLVQQRRGVLAWRTKDNEITRIPLQVQADRSPHTYIFPVGAHKNWHSWVRDIEIEFPNQDTLPLIIADAFLLERPWWAFDLLLLRLLQPITYQYPPWEQVVLLSMFILITGLSILVPMATWRYRIAASVAGIVLIYSAYTFLYYTQIVISIAAVRASFPTAVPVQTYNAPEALNGVVHQLRNSLPIGTILLLDHNPDGWLASRLRYELYPRPLVVIPPTLSASELMDTYLDDKGVVGMIVQNDLFVGPISWHSTHLPVATLSAWTRSAPARLEGSDTSTYTTVQMARAVLGICLTLILGKNITSLFKVSGVIAWLIAWPIGLTVIILLLFMTDFVFGSIFWPIVPVAFLLSIVLLKVWPTKDLLLRIDLFRDRSWIDYTSLVIITVLFGLSCFHAQLLPYNDIDTWRNWGLKAQAIFHETSVSPILQLYAPLQEFHADYPPLQPLSLAWMYAVAGVSSSPLAKLLFPLWYACGCLTIYCVARYWSTSFMALVSMLLFASTPLMLDHSTLANADLPLAIFILWVGVALSCWLQEGKSHYIYLALILAVGAIWIKIDGLPLALAMFGSALLVRILHPLRIATEQKRVLKRVSIITAILPLLLLPWFIYVQRLALPKSTELLTVSATSDLALLSRAIHVIGSEVITSYSNSTWSLMGGGFGVFWMACFTLLGIAPKNSTREPVLQFLLLSTVFGVGLYVGAYVQFPFLSIERYLLHIAPLILLAALWANRRLGHTSGKSSCVLTPGMYHAPQRK